MDTRTASALLFGFIGAVLSTPSFSDDSQKSADTPSVREYAGCLYIGMEDWYFSPQHAISGSRWSISDQSSQSFIAEVRAIARGSDYYVYARVRGSVGPEGRFGYSGLSSREITVFEMIELRDLKVADGECGVPIPAPAKPSANNRVEFTRAARPTRKSTALLLAAHAERSAS